MKKIFANTLFLLFLSAFVLTCKEDVDILGPYEENLFVFGLLDASQTTQKIKIYKIFAGLNGKQSAQNLDSIYYKNGEIDVQLLEYRGDKIKAIDFKYANDGQLEPNGDFNTNSAVYYYTNEPILVNSTYKLVIKAKSKTVTSELIKIADSCNFEPTLFSVANFGSDIVYRHDRVSFGFKDTIRALKIVFGQSPNVKGINLKVKFTYGNYNIFEALINKETVIYNLKNVNFSSTNPNEKASYDFNVNAFCAFLGKTITFNPIAVRYQRALAMDFTFTTFDKEMETYLIVQNESTGLSQEKLSYSNVKNGLGFIGSKNSITYYRDARDAGSEGLNKIIGRNAASRKLGFGN